MGEVIATSAALQVAMALLAVVLVFTLLRLRDVLVQVDFKQVVRRIANEPMAAAVYYGVTFLGACLLVGLVLS